MMMSVILRNMKLKTLSWFALAPLLLSSCGYNPDSPVHIAQNGDLFAVDEPVVADQTSEYVRRTDSDEILSLLDNAEPFILYVGYDSCSACRAFKPHLLRYVYETKALIYYLDASDGTDLLEYSKIWQRYQDIFMAGVETPYLMVIENTQSYAKGAVSKMTSDTYAPFANMMSQLVKITNVISMVTYQAADYYLNNEAKSLYFFYDRTDEEARGIYANKILPAAEESEQRLNVVDFHDYDETDLDALQATFGLGETIGPIAQYYEDGVLSEAHPFGIDEVSDQVFLDQYL